MDTRLTTEQTPLPVDDVAGDRVLQVLQHPLFTDEVMLPTRPIDVVFMDVRRAVLLRKPGCVFEGESGIGKTFALNMVKAMLLRQLPALRIYSHDAHNHQIPSIRAFFKHFLNTVGHEEQRGETYDLRTRLVNILVDDARLSGINFIVIFIDEANAMLLSDFLFLKDVYNDLARQGVQLVTILMGQSPEIGTVINTLREEGRMDLIGRFATEINPIPAFNCEEDFARVFRGIDKSEYPENSGISWPAFFLPQACASGFTLEGEATRFFNVVVKQAASRDEGTIRVPARQAFLAVREFMLNQSGKDRASMTVSDDAWDLAIRQARVADAIIRNQQGQVRPISGREKRK